MARPDLRRNDEIRKVKIETNFTQYADGSVLIKQGNTWVVCTATIENSVPENLKGTGKGYINVEFSMLPSATSKRRARDIENMQISQSSVEIQRIIGRSLRSVCDLETLGERTIIIDCDVLQADGGTRCVSITGGYIALALAVKKLVRRGEIDINPIMSNVASINVGLIEEESRIDLSFDENVNVQAKLNVVITARGDIVEVSGTGEERPFSKQEMDKMVALAKRGILKLLREQDKAIGGF